MDIVVEIDSKTFPAVFLAKRGPEEFDVSQLAVYQVDRMLGVSSSDAQLPGLPHPGKVLESPGFFCCPGKSLKVLENIW